jgi:hypothetical protein
MASKIGPWGLSTASVELIWYYTRGQTLSERSTMGPMLAQAERASAGCRRCARCNRTSPRGQRVHLVDPERDGGTPGILADGSWCPACRGTGVVPCGWRSSRKAPTARPTGHEVRAHGVLVDDRDRMRAAEVSRWLWRVAKRDSHAAQALEAYFGNDSGVGEGTTWGQLLGVMAITQAGRRLLRASRGEARRPVERLRTLATLGSLGDKGEARQAALVAAADQAAALLRDGLALYLKGRGVER